MTAKIGILTVSDRASTGQYEDKSGPMIVKVLSNQSGWLITQQSIIPDDFDLIVAVLREWKDAGIDLIFTTGGTGFAPRDITPEATMQVVDRLAPGIAEAMRYESLQVTRHAMLSRGVAGISGNTLIINLPGSPKAVRENLQIILPVLPHALELIRSSDSSESSHRVV